MTSWLKNAIFYQIYPISFFDSNGDGMGDIQGIIQKVDYLKELGVDAVWLNPIYKSPFKDGGYDISDYYTIDKRFGRMSDLEDLIKVFKKNNIKIVLDVVFGHTSNKHNWFKRCAQVKRNPYSDYYIWSDSNFDEYDGKLIKGLYYRDGGYLMNYYASQPALNFGFNSPDKDASWQMHYTDERLKPLREELLNILRFYLDKGVDGFRFDMAGHMVKGCQWDSEDDEVMQGNIWFWNQVLGTLRKEYQERVYIAEWVYPINSVGKCGFDFDFLTHDTPSFNELFRNEANTNLLRSLELGDNYFSENGKGSLKNFVEYAENLYSSLEGKGYFCTPSGSHDEIRISQGKSLDLLKVVFAFLLTYKNIAFIYYGDEIGIKHNFSVSKDGGSVRTGARTPMQWTSGPHCGFTTKRTPYLPTDNNVALTVEMQEKDENSLLNTVKKLIKIRKEYACLYADAEQEFLETEYPAVYERTDGKQTIRVYLNPSNQIVNRKIEEKYQTLLAQNVVIENDNIYLEKQSFLIILI